MATQIWVHVYLDNGDLYTEVPVVSHEAAGTISRRWEIEGFDTEVVTCSDH
jgi:hypothetical protein